MDECRFWQVLKQKSIFTLGIETGNARICYFIIKGLLRVLLNCQDLSIPNFSLFGIFMSIKYWHAFITWYCTRWFGVLQCSTTTTLGVFYVLYVVRWSLCWLNQSGGSALEEIPCDVICLRKKKTCPGMGKIKFVDNITNIHINCHKTADMLFLHKIQHIYQFSRLFGEKYIYPRGSL